MQKTKLRTPRSSFDGSTEVGRVLLRGIYVQRPNAEKFIVEFTKAMSALVLGPGFQLEVNLGASVSRKERNKIADLVNAAMGEGGKIMMGGMVAINGGDI